MNGGAERVIHRLITNWLSQTETEVSLILMHNNQPVFYDIPAGCKVTKIESGRKSRLFEKLDRYRKLRKIIQKEKPDVVLSMPEEIGIYVLLALAGTKIPVVVSERNNPWVMPDRKVTRMLRRILYPHAKGLIFQTSQAASFFSEKLRHKGVVLPNPLNIQELPQPYSGVRETVIVGAGRLHKQKNFPLLIDAFSDFYPDHPEYRLVIYGEGDLRGELETYARAKQLPEGTICFPGRTKTLAEEMRTKAMFVLSSDYEGMPNVVIEAMAMGVPVISTDCPSGGSAELIRSGESGLLVPVGDRRALAAAMKQIADDSALSETLSRNGPEVRLRLDSKKIAKAWMEYLEHAAGVK